MAQRPATRTAPPRSRRRRDAAPAEWLELPRWRQPLDTLLVLAVAASTAWLGLVVLPAAASGDDAAHP